MRKFLKIILFCSAEISCMLIRGWQYKDTDDEPMQVRDETHATNSFKVF